MNTHEMEYIRLRNKLDLVCHALMPGEYSSLLDALVLRDIDGIVEVISSICKEKIELDKRLTKSYDELCELSVGLSKGEKGAKEHMAELDAEIRDKDLVIANLERQREPDMERKDAEVAALKKQLEESKQREQVLSMGMTIEDGEKMKAEYQQGKSLRQLSKTYGCDKSTVKRRLIRMGVEIRE